MTNSCTGCRVAGILIVACSIFSWIMIGGPFTDLLGKPSDVGWLSPILSVVSHGIKQSEGVVIQSCLNILSFVLLYGQGTRKWLLILTLAWSLVMMMVKVCANLLGTDTLRSLAAMMVMDMGSPFTPLVIMFAIYFANRFLIVSNT